MNVRPPAMNQKELAKAVGVDERTLRRYRTRGCTAQTPEGIQEWRENNIDLKEDAEAAGLNEDLLAARVLKEEEAGEKLRLENEVARGEVIDAEEMERVLCEAVAMIRAHIEAIPADIAAEISNPEERLVVLHKAKLRCRAALVAIANVRVSDANPANSSG